MNATDLTVCVESDLKWFTFNQNNSGGRFDHDKFVDVVVIIQAHSGDEANDLAERVGIYFNGVEDQMDCECCGDRWSRQYNEYGTDVPSHYGEPVAWSPDSVCHSGNIIVYPYKIISSM